MIKQSPAKATIDDCRRGFELVGTLVPRAAAPRDQTTPAAGWTSCWRSSMWRESIERGDEAPQTRAGYPLQTLWARRSWGDAVAHQSGGRFDAAPSPGTGAAIATAIGGAAKALREIVADPRARSTTHGCPMRLRASLTPASTHSTSTAAACSISPFAPGIVWPMLYINAAIMRLSHGLPSQLRPVTTPKPGSAMPPVAPTVQGSPPTIDGAMICGVFRSVSV